MAKKRKTNFKQQQTSSSLTMVIVIVLVVIVAGGSLMATMGGTTAGGAVSGQSTSSLESNVKTLTEQVKSNPKNASLQESLGTALFNLANSYMQTNDPKTQETLTKTIEVYNEALKLKPNSKETLGDLATAYFYSNQTDLAISTVEKALKIDPAFVPALMNYGIYLADGKGDYANAIKQWEKIPAGSPEYSQAQSFIKDYKNQASSSSANTFTPSN